MAVKPTNRYPVQPPAIGGHMSTSSVTSTPTLISHQTTDWRQIVRLQMSTLLCLTWVSRAAACGQILGKIVDNLGHYNEKCPSSKIFSNG